MCDVAVNKNNLLAKLQPKTWIFTRFHFDDLFAARILSALARFKENEYLAGGSKDAQATAEPGARVEAALG